MGKRTKSIGRALIQGMAFYIGIAGLLPPLAGQEAARVLSFGRFSGDAQAYPDSAVDRIQAAKIAGQEALLLVLMSLEIETAFLRSGTDLGVEGLVLTAVNSPASVVISGRRGEIILGEEAGKPLVTVESGVTLTLRNIALRGRFDRSGVPLIRVASGGRLILESGAAITDISGNGVQVEEGGVFIAGSKEQEAEETEGEE
jgi:hypothetical protein